MNSRERLLRIMHYEEFDRMPVWHWTGWPETMERWYGEGLPRDADPCEFFGAEPLITANCLPVNVGLLPAFEEELIEETEDHRVIRQTDGVIARHIKGRSSIPQHIDYLLKDRSGWDEYRKRLQPAPERIGENLVQVAADLKAAGQPICLHTASMVGFTRNWMGVENFGLTCCEDPDLIAEIADAHADLVCWCIDQIPSDIQIDMGWAWEDICFRNGPLVPPKVFRDAAVPAYSKISEKLRARGCNLHAVDCDGKVDLLVPLWLEAGVNVMFPIEVGVWGGDPMPFREQYGNDLRVIGAFNKSVLEKDRPAIDAEIERLKPMMRAGGYIPLPDHLMTPDTPLDNYRYYLDQMRDLKL